MFTTKFFKQTCQKFRLISVILKGNWGQKERATNICGDLFIFHELRSFELYISRRYSHEST